MRQPLKVSELLLANRVISAVGGRRKVSIVVEHESPWILLLFEPSWGDEATPLNRKLEFAIWRRTLAVYRVRRGAVDDDPILEQSDRVTLDEVRKMMEEDEAGVI